MKHTSTWSSTSGEEYDGGHSGSCDPDLPRTDIRTRPAKVPGKAERPWACARDSSHGHWETCRLPDLAVRALDPFNMGGAISLYGPPCTLPEESCVPLVLALHELATNAVKYGSLSTQSGNVDVLWRFHETEANETDLVLEWIERGGPEVEQPPPRSRIEAAAAPARLPCCAAKLRCDWRDLPDSNFRRTGIFRQVLTKSSVRHPRSTRPKRRCRVPSSDWARRPVDVWISALAQSCHTLMAALGRKLPPQVWVKS